MTKKRPVGVTVFAILNLIFGGLGLVCNLCNVVAAPALESLQVNQDPDNAATNMEKHLQANVPGYVAFEWTQLGLNLLLSALLVIAGIGLLRMSPAGRWLCIVICVIEILVITISMVYLFAYINPAISEWEKVNAGQMPPGLTSLIVTGFAAIVAFIEILYAVILLTYLLLPGTAKAFAIPGRELQGPDAEQEYFDSEFERRRRERPPET
jgi:hypothetical protein